MKIKGQFCYTNANGEDIYQFTLTNYKGTAVTISNYGAIITSYKIMQSNGNWNDIVLGFEKMEDYLHPDYISNYPWFGAAIGRYGNRIKDGSITIDGVHYQLSKNDKNNQLHGGREGFDKKTWEVVEVDGAKLHLAYTSPDGEEGYPGNLFVEVIYQLGDDDALTYEFRASCDKPTAVNLTHHSYFNLDNGEGTIKEHFLRIYAQHVLEQDPDLVVTGKLLPVKDSTFDFTSPKMISRDWDETKGYDQSFDTGKKDQSFSLMAEAWSRKSGIKLEVWSTEPVVHFYSGVWIPDVVGKNEITYVPFSGFCLETQIHPNAINIPEFPSTILRPGENYYHKTTYRVSAADLK
jgi:aldose 1-epimerase